MTTLSDFLESARYDLTDYETGVEFEDRELINYLNRMIGIVDSTLLILRSDILHGTEADIDTVASQDYVDLTNLNNGNWDSIREVWIGDDRKEHVSVPMMYYKRKFYSGDAEPQYFAIEGNRMLFETACDAAHTDLVIHYNKKTRPRLETWSDTFTVNATTDILTLASGNHTFTTGDGIFTLSNSGGALPSGLAASTNYWSVVTPSDLDGLRLATSKMKAISETEYGSGYTLVVGKVYKILAQQSIDYTSYGADDNNVGTMFTCTAAGSLSTDDDGVEDRVYLTEAVDLAGTGSGTHTITLSDTMPYDDRYNELLREMLVLHAKGKREGQTSRPDALFHRTFRKRMFEEEVRRRFQEPHQWLGF